MAIFHNFYIYFTATMFCYSADSQAHYLLLKITLLTKYCSKPVL